MLPPVSGFLNIYKRCGPTSYDYIRALQRIYRAESLKSPKIGHMGTLDPVAEGVLPVAIGSARRLIRFFKADKVYSATIRLGLATDTDDIQGETIRQCEATGLTERIIRQTLDGFVGKIKQVPPRYSAALSDGVRAYRRARRGENFYLEPRTVTVRSAEITGWDAPDLIVRLVVGPGTYVRSIARDLGEALGTGGCVASLKREADGPFLASDSTGIAELEQEGVDGIEGHLLKPDFILDGWPRVDLSTEDGVEFCRGKFLPGVGLPAETVDGFLAIYDPHGFIGVGMKDPDGSLKPYRVIRTTV
jgi:tRNA pseudouridine55 synthase